MCANAQSPFRWLHRGPKTNANPTDVVQCGSKSTHPSKRKPFNQTNKQTKTLVSTSTLETFAFPRYRPASAPMRFGAPGARASHRRPPGTAGLPGRRAPPPWPRRSSLASGVTRWVEDGVPFWRLLPGPQTTKTTGGW